MKLNSLIVYRFVCLLLMVHLFAVNIRYDYYLSFFNTTNISKDFDIEEESLPKSKSSETNNSEYNNDEFLNNINSINKITTSEVFTESAKKLTFYFSINALLSVHYEIQSPPPRT